MNDEVRVKLEPREMWGCYPADGDGGPPLYYGGSRVEGCDPLAVFRSRAAAEKWARDSDFGPSVIIGRLYTGAQVDGARIEQMEVSRAYYEGEGAGAAERGGPLSQPSSDLIDFLDDLGTAVHQFACVETSDTAASLLASQVETWARLWMRDRGILRAATGDRPPVGLVEAAERARLLIHRWFDWEHTTPAIIDHGRLGAEYNLSRKQEKQHIDDERVVVMRAFQAALLAAGQSGDRPAPSPAVTRADLQVMLGALVIDYRTYWDAEEDLLAHEAKWKATRDAILDRVCGGEAGPPAPSESPRP